MALSFFDDKSNPPADKALKDALKNNYPHWGRVKSFVFEHYPASTEEWAFSGKNYGWGFRLRDKKRVIVYLTPCDGFFKTSLVFGQKAFEEIMKSKVSREIKKILEEAPVYAEGHGFRIDIKDEKYLSDLEKLILVKLKY